MKEQDLIHMSENTERIDMYVKMIKEKLSVPGIPDMDKVISHLDHIGESTHLLRVSVTVVAAYLQKKNYQSS